MKSETLLMPSSVYMSRTLHNGTNKPGDILATQRRFFMWTTKTDQTARMRMMICVFLGRTSEGRFSPVAAQIM